MRGFFSSSAGARSLGSSAAQPASEPDIVASAEQPGPELQTLKDVQQWLATAQVHVDNPDVQRVREAVGILANPRPRQEDVRLLQKPANWNVAQQVKRKPRPLPDVIEELKRKVG